MKLLKIFEFKKFVTQISGLNYRRFQKKKKSLISIYISTYLYLSLSLFYSSLSLSLSLSVSLSVYLSVEIILQTTNLINRI